MKKGISSVVAVILLLAITISLIGFTFFWFSRITQMTANSTEQQLIEQQHKIYIGVSLLSVVNNTEEGSDIKVTLRNTGSQSIRPTDLAFVVTNQDNTADTETVTAYTGPGGATTANDLPPGISEVRITTTICDGSAKTLSITADLGTQKDTISYTCPIVA
ncbi:MAG: hypothetical protein HY832_02910 [Candidatus Aenigmarchaeota archaeon]|nr:hypothetical protein [Candidatus Aenigmarchaeota archaeon]